MEKIKLLMIALIIGFSSTSWAQIDVSGVVTDNQNIPIPGVNVVIKGTSTGSATDFDGKYEIKANVGDVLVFSYLGYQTLELAYSGGATLDAKLNEDAAQLDEVVVIGYGSVKKSDLTGSVVQISSKQIEQANKVDAVSALQGQSAGVVIQRTDNKPGGGGFNIRIRGASTINSNDANGFNPGQNPLFIVDGIFVDDISFLNPADISSMNVLKDASATAIYGSRGSNGVVLIETKRGKSGKTKVDYSNYVGFKQAYHLPSVFNAAEYVKFVKDAAVGGQFVSGNTSYRASDVDVTDGIFDAEEQQNIAEGIDTDWIDLMLKNGFQTNHTLGLSGGNDTTTYSAGLAYTEDEGTAEGEDYTRYNIRGSLSSDLNDWLNISVSNYVTSVVQNQGSYEGFRSAYRLKPIGRPYNDDGSLRFFPTNKETQITNPLFEAGGEIRETKFLQYIGDIAIEVKPIEALTITSKFSPNLKYTRFGEYRSLYTKSVSGNASNRRAQVNNSNYFSYAWDNIFNYKFNKGDHALDVTAVISRFLERSEGYYNQVRNFTTDEFTFYNLDAGLDIRDVSSDFSKQTLESYTSRINYTLMDKYLFTVTGRYDGASILAKDNKWAFFPSAAFAWKIIDEGFMQNQQTFSNAKLRLSYGETGNNGTGGGLYPLGSQSLLGASATNLGDQAVSTTYVTGIANKDLTWERTTEINLGLDFGFMNNKINGSIDIYNRDIDGIIFERQLPTLTGLNRLGVFENIGSSNNKGIEIALNTINVDNGNFKWTTNFNFASNKNELKKLANGNIDIPFNVGGTSLIHRVGEPIGAIYDYEFAGIWQLDEEAEAASYGQIPGQVKVTDVTNDGQITSADRKIIGQVTPKWTGGFTSTMNYKNFDFSFMINTSQGAKMRSNFHANYAWGWQEQPQRTFNGYNVDYWTPENQSNDWNQPGNPGPFGHAIQYKDISFTKVGFITLGYKLPSTILEKLKISNLRIYATVQNPFVFTDYDGWDPENAGRNQWGAAYMSRTLMTGINLSF
ncbi:SusC/RagA family TonB-linked outer membrane protein [Thalassobellus suaedae]|uniref:TonB-dependent receptor n=1 Tax=Thalassobellus suaedae TaxID=3074124 RepID=A0ABY9XTF8_9FLAO|nr:TonB-dependent receptor [Flavobacteriaceae bacterium HL-DH14]